MQRGGGLQGTEPYPGCKGQSPTQTGSGDRHHSWLEGARARCAGLNAEAEGAGEGGTWQALASQKEINSLTVLYCSPLRLEGREPSIPRKDPEPHGDKGKGSPGASEDSPAGMFSSWLVTTLHYRALPSLCAPSLSGTTCFGLHHPARALAHGTGCTWGCFCHRSSGVPVSPAW